MNLCCMGAGLVTSAASGARRWVDHALPHTSAAHPSCPRQLMRPMQSNAPHPRIHSYQQRLCNLMLMISPQPLDPPFRTFKPHAAPHAAHDAHASSISLSNSLCRTQFSSLLIEVLCLALLPCSPAASGPCGPVGCQGHHHNFA